MKRAVYDIFIAAAKHLSVEHFDVVFESLNTLNVTDVDAPVLTLITTLTKSALQVAATVSPRMRLRCLHNQFVWILCICMLFISDAWCC